MIKLPPLPYNYDALEPTISAKTMHLHHDVHHAGYVKNLNKIIEEKEWPTNTDEKFLLIRGIQNDGWKRIPGLLNNLGQHLNHSLFWQVMSPQPSKPSVLLKQMIERDFGSLAEMTRQFVTAGTQVFGSGWAMLVLSIRPQTKPAKLRLTINQYVLGDNPWVTGHGIPLFLCDVWEHAYYLDYQSDREAYLKTWFKLLNWDVVSHRFSEAKLMHELKGYMSYFAPSP